LSATRGDPGARPLPHVAGVEHHYGYAGGVRLHVATAGTGPPLLLIHGYPQHWYVWRRLIPALAGRYRVICPDLRGFGWSDVPAAGYDKETLARDMVALLDALAIDRCRVGGHDWGGWIAMLMAMLRPERVESVLAVSIMHPFLAPSAGLALATWRVWHGLLLGSPVLGPRAARAPSGTMQAIARWLGAASWSDAERRVFLGQFEERARADAAHRLYAANGSVDFPRALGGRYRRLRLTRPALAVLGARDRAVFPWRRRDYERYAPDLRVETIDAGHAVPEEQPELLLQLAQAFFANGAANEEGAIATAGARR
jgi:pimeloyl-ACP methyl ester carboxylesterase